MRAMVVRRYGPPQVLEPQQLADPQPKPDELFGLYGAGKIKSVVGETFPFGQAAEAHRYIPDRNNTGKVILTVR